MKREEPFACVKEPSESGEKPSESDEVKPSENDETEQSAENGEKQPEGDKRKLQIRDNLREIFASLPEGVTLLGATKTVPAEYINFAADCGLRVIGENRVNELLEKYPLLDRTRLDIQFIGHLQTNKVKYIIDKVSLIHSVDSERLAEEISRRALAAGKVMPVLVEVNIGGEESKFGVSPADLPDFVVGIAALRGISVRGLMTIPPPSTDICKNTAIYERLRKISVDISALNVDNVSMGVLSAGMTGDWKTAVSCGSTMVRIGTGIFGSRL